MSRPITWTAFALRTSELAAPHKCATVPRRPWIAARRNELRTTTSIFQCQQPQRRPFSSSRAQKNPTLKPKRLSQPSMNVQRQAQRDSALRSGQFPDDLGLMTQTFVMPHGKNCPGLFTNERWMLEKSRIKIRFQELLSALAYKWWLIHPRPKLGLKSIAFHAKELHKDLYTRFAEGDLTPVEKNTCSGLLSSLRKRLAIRAPNTTMKWTVHKYISNPKLVSYKAITLPGPKDQPKTEVSGLVQAVVRLHTLQSLARFKRITSARAARGQVATTELVPVDEMGRPLESEAASEEVMRRNAKESVEYIVIQKSLRMGKEGPWMVWGNAEEMTVSKLKSQEGGAKAQAA